MAAKQAVDKLISEHLVAVFSKSYCPYCAQAKTLIGKLGLDPSKVGVVELDTMGSQGSDIQAYLGDMTGQRTVPNIFINKKHLGGNSDLQSAHSSGRLSEMLKA